MKKIVLLFSLSVLALAHAGTRAKDSTGSIPTSALDGVNLSEVQGCRMSVRVDGGGSINGGTLSPYYYDAINGWVRPESVLDCTLSSFDGGTTAAHVCPDQEVLARFGRVAAVASNLVRADGGSPNGTGVDGGANLAPVVRIECWGPTLP